MNLFSNLENWLRSFVSDFISKIYREYIWILNSYKRHVETVASPVHERTGFPITLNDSNLLNEIKRYIKLHRSLICCVLHSTSFCRRWLIWISVLTPYHRLLCLIWVKEDRNWAAVEQRCVTLSNQTRCHPIRTDYRITR